jgi:O-antigen ligase
MTARGLLGQFALALTVLFLSATLVLPYNGGFVLAYALMALTLVIAIALLLARGRWQVGPADWCFVVAFALIAIAFSIDGDAPLMVNFIFLLAFVPLSSWLARYAATDSAIVVAFVALAGSLLTFITALVDIYYWQAPRAEGWWSDAIWSAQAALVLGFLALLAMPVMTSRWRYLLLLGPAFGVGAVLLSGSGGPLVAAPVVALVLALTTFRRWWKQIALLAFAAVATLAVTLPLAPGVLHRAERTGAVLVQLVTTGTSDEPSVAPRLAFWKAGIEAFTHRPLSGYGWSHRVRAAYEFLPDKGAAFDAGLSGLNGNHHLHADILDMGVAGGVLGLAAYGLILLAPLLGALRSVHDSQYTARLTGALILTASYFMCGLTYLMFGYEFHTTLYVCLAAIVLGFCRDARPA